MIYYHRRGGLHFLRIGSLRITWSIRKRYKALPKISDYRWI